MRALFRRLSDAWDVLIGRASALKTPTRCLDGHAPVVGEMTTLIDHDVPEFSSGEYTIKRVFYPAIWDGERFVRIDSPEGEAVVRRCSVEHYT